MIVGRSVGVMTLPTESTVFQRRILCMLLLRSTAEGEEMQWAPEAQQKPCAP